MDEDVIGFTIQFVTNAPYAWTELREFEYTNENNDPEPQTYTITVNNSERLHEIFPVIKILPNLSSEHNKVPVTIKNLRDGGEMNLTLLKDETTIDCERGIISGTAGLLSFDSLGIDDVDQIYWLRLYDGDNSIELTGDAQITISFREPRKVGAY